MKTQSWTFDNWIFKGKRKINHTSTKQPECFGWLFFDNILDRYGLVQQSFSLQ